MEEVEILPPGTRLEGYVIDRLLGEGGMGFVYGAVQEILHRRVAIKMLRPELSQHDQILTRFLNEAKAVNLINHQNIVNVYNYGDWGPGSAYFEMEYLEGETLEDLMRRQRPMPLPLMLNVFGQIAKALVAAHAKQIVHRDLKPGNVFLVAREDNPHFVKLLDFGIAQLRGAGAVQGLTLAGSVLGTPQYMSPEQIGGGTIDARTDVWAMGVMMYRAATGKQPFEGEEFVQLADKILHYPPPPPHEVAAMPMELSRLISHCLTRKVEDRLASINELIAGFRRVQREVGLDEDTIIGATRAAAAKAGLHPSVDRKPARSKLVRHVLVGGAAFVIAAIAVGLWAHSRGQTTPSPPPTKPTEIVTSAAPPAPPTIKTLVAAGRLAEARALAARDLRDAITSGTLQQKGFAVEAIGKAHVAAGAPLLYPALGGDPDVRIKAARALGELALPDSAPKLRDALSTSGDRLRVELAALLFKLGDPDVRTILLRQTTEPTMRLTAASALAEVGDPAGRAVLLDELAPDQPVNDSWRRAARGLIKLGDAATRNRLERELAQPDAARAVGAASILAEAGDPKATEQLARSAADPAFARPGEAAVALARIGDRRALDWLDRGFASPDTTERQQALAVSGWLRATPRMQGVANLATDDPDLRVRLTAEAVLLGL